MSAFYPRWEEDVLKRDFAPRKVPLLPPTEALEDEPNVCVIVNASWVSHVIGVLETLIQPDAWIGTSEEIYTAQQQIELLMSNLVNGSCPLPTQLRVVDCQLQIYNEDTAVWDDVAGAAFVRLDGSCPMTGDLSFEPTGKTQRGGIAFPDTGNMWVGTETNHPLVFKANGGRRVTINSDGRVSIANTAAFAAQLTVIDGNAARVGAVVRGAASQSANLQEWQSSASAILASISSLGGALFRDEVKLQGQSSTQMRDMARLRSEWSVNADATRAAQWALSAYDYGGEREVLRGGANGTEALFAAFGGTPAALQTVTGIAPSGSALASLLSAMAAYNWIDNQTTPGEAFMLRQNPANSCQLQQSVDGGETWTLAFDFSLCIPPATQIIVDTVINNNQWVNIWNLTVTFISQPGYSDTQKNLAAQALCYAAQAITALMMDTSYQVKQGNLNTISNTSIVVGIVAGVVAIFVTGMSLATLAPLGLLIASGALQFYANIQTLAAGVWLDQGNRDAMACLMYQNLANAAVNLANFQTAFDNADCLTADQQQIASILSGILNNPVEAQPIFDAFMNALGDANRAGQAGLLSATCVCPDDEWCVRIRPSNARGMVTFEAFECSCSPLDEANANLGTVNTALDRWDFTVGSQVAALQMRIEIFIPDGATLTQVLAHGEYGSGIRAMCVKRNGTELGCGTGIGISATDAGWGTFYSPLQGTTVTQIRMGNNTLTADGYVEYIEVKGTGTPILGLCSDC